MGEFVNDLTVKLPCKVVVKSYRYGNFILSPTVILKKQQLVSDRHFQCVGIVIQGQINWLKPQKRKQCTVLKLQHVSATKKA